MQCSMFPNKAFCVVEYRKNIIVNSMLFKQIHFQYSVIIIQCNVLCSLIQHSVPTATLHPSPFWFFQVGPLLRVPTWKETEGCRVGKKQKGEGWSVVVGTECCIREHRTLHCMMRTEY